MFEPIILIALVVIACYAVFSDNLRRSIIFLGVFSLTMAMAYLHYNAPDVAIAEAAIGVGLSTVMYLIALKKVSVYDICFINENVETFNDEHIKEIMDPIVRPLELFIEKTEEVEPQIAYTNRQLAEVIEEDNHDCFIHRKGNITYIYGESTDQIFREIIANLEDIITDVKDIRVIYRDEVELDGADEH